MLFRSVGALSHRLEARMPNDVARKEIARLDVRRLEVLRKVVAREAGIGLHGHQKTEPRWIALLVLLEKPQPRHILQPFVEAGEVPLARLNERWELIF